MPAGLSFELIAKVPTSQYHSIFSVAHNRWYHPTLEGNSLIEPRVLVRNATITLLVSRYQT